jgi:predicted dehydrogenase
VTLAIALFGCGGFARRYHVPALRADPRVRIAWICDTAPEPLGALAREAGAQLTTRVEDILAPDACTAVILSTPHTLHADHARRCIVAGKHLLVDKPFVLHDRDAAELAAAAAARGIVAAVAFTRRFDAGSLRARELVAAGAIGAIRYVESIQLGYEKGGWFLDPALGGGGPFTGRGSHIADLLPWLLQRAPTRVRAVTRPGPAGKADEGGFIELDFGALRCHLTCLAGVTGGLHMWDEIRIYGEDGLIELKRPLDLPLGWQLTRWGRARDPVETVVADGTPGPSTRDFVDVVLGLRPAPACSFADARVSVRVIELAFESARQDGRWLEVAGVG